MADPRGLQIVRHHLLPVGLEQQLSIPYRQTTNGIYRAFVLAKGGDDFTDAEVVLAQRIQPLLILLARQCCVLVGYTADDRREGITPTVHDGKGGGDITMLGLSRQRHPEAIPTTQAEIRGERAVAWRPGVGAILFDPTL